MRLSCNGGPILCEVKFDKTIVGGKLVKYDIPTITTNDNQFLAFQFNNVNLDSPTCIPIMGEYNEMLSTDENGNTSKIVPITGITYVELVRCNPQDNGSLYYEYVNKEWYAEFELETQEPFVF